MAKSAFGIILTGQEFNKRFEKYLPFCKILHESLCHHGFQYEIGKLNSIETHEEFNPSGRCQNGGLYFTFLNAISNFICNGTLLAMVSIPDDAKVYVDGSDDSDFVLNLLSDHNHYVPKFKTNCLNLISIGPIPQHIFFKAVDQNCYRLEHVPIKEKLLYPQLCLNAVKTRGECLMYVPESLKFLLPGICFEAVKQDGLALEHVPQKFIKSYPDICIIAINQNGEALEFVSENLKIRNFKLCEDAVTQNANAIKFVPESVMMSNPNICLISVEKDGLLLYYVPDELMISHPTICTKAVKQNGFSLEYVPECLKLKHTDICFDAAMHHEEALEFVPESVKRLYPELLGMCCANYRHSPGG